MSTFGKLFSGLGRFLKGSPVDRRLGDVRRERRGLEQRRTTANEVRDLAARKRAESQAGLEGRRRQKAQDEREADPVYRFVIKGETAADFHSSNVRSAWYELANARLFIQYLDGSTYQYEDVSPAEAESFIRAGSKGAWVWDNLRLRGTKLGARKEYALAFSGAKPRAWEMTPEDALAHASRVAEQSGASGTYEKLGKFARDKPQGNIGRRG